MNLKEERQVATALFVFAAGEQLQAELVRVAVGGAERPATPATTPYGQTVKKPAPRSTTTYSNSNPRRPIHIDAISNKVDLLPQDTQRRERERGEEWMTIRAVERGWLGWGCYPPPLPNSSTRNQRLFLGICGT